MRDVEAAAAAARKEADAQAAAVEKAAAEVSAEVTEAREAAAQAEVDRVVSASQTNIMLAMGEEQHAADKTNGDVYNDGPIVDSDSEDDVKSVDLSADNFSDSLDEIIESTPLTSPQNSNTLGVKPGQNVEQLIQTNPAQEGGATITGNDDDDDDYGEVSDFSDGFSDSDGDGRVNLKSDVNTSAAHGVGNESPPEERTAPDAQMSNSSGDGVSAFNNDIGSSNSSFDDASELNETPDGKDSQREADMKPAPVPALVPVPVSVVAAARKPGPTLTPAAGTVPARAPASSNGTPDESLSDVGSAEFSEISSDALSSSAAGAPVPAPAVVHAPAPAPAPLPQPTDDSYSEVGSTEFSDISSNNASEANEGEEEKNADGKTLDTPAAKRDDASADTDESYSAGSDFDDSDFDDFDD